MYFIVFFLDNYCIFFHYGLEINIKSSFFYKILWYHQKKKLYNFYHPHKRMILLMGMNTSLMMYPMKPITKKPIAQACKILRYSIRIKDEDRDEGRDVTYRSCRAWRTCWRKPWSRWQTPESTERSSCSCLPCGP